MHRVLQLVDFLLFIDTNGSGTHIDQKQEPAHDGKDLEEIVLGEILVGVMRMKLGQSLVWTPVITGEQLRITYSPEVVDQEVEDGQNQHQDDGAQLRLQAHHNHDASHKPDQAD
jgi:hypothetical protein